MLVCSACAHALPRLLRAAEAGRAETQALAGQLDDFVSSQALTNLLLFSYTLSFVESERVTSAPTVVTVQSVLLVTTTYT